MTPPPAALFLADGSRFDGHGLGFEGLALGEAVFYTGMTGYEEALTDPSYAGQILTFTYPMIGNYGVSGSAAQYPRACVAGTVIKQISHHPSHHLAKIDLPSWLDEQQVPALIGADTRAITITLREHGTIWAALATGKIAIEDAERALSEFARHACTKDLVPSVATREQATDGASF
jgi:carbamoyl-phosphate synthase small subunit